MPLPVAEMGSETDQQCAGPDCSAFFLERQRPRSSKRHGGDIATQAAGRPNLYFPKECHLRSRFPLDVPGAFDAGVIATKSSTLISSQIASKTSAVYMRTSIMQGFASSSASREHPRLASTIQPLA